MKEKVVDPDRVLALAKEQKRNIIFTKSVKCEQIVKGLGISMATLRAIGPCLCYTCSGVNLNNKKVYRLFNNFEDLKEHCRRYHDKQISKGCILNLEKPVDMVIIEITQGGSSRFAMMKKDDYVPLHPISDVMSNLIKEKKRKIVDKIKSQPRDLNNTKKTFNFLEGIRKIDRRVCDMSVFNITKENRNCDNRKI